MILFFDTETTGVYDFRGQPTDLHQPHLVQVAATVATLDQRVVAQLNVIVQPDGWSVPEEAARIHGITHEFALLHGVPRRAALAMFSNLAKLAQYSIAYNMDFDANVLWSQFARERVEPVSFRSTKLICAMKAATPVCKIPKAAGGVYRTSDPYKWPKLAEAHQHFFGTGFDGAHNAMVDVEAMMRVTFKMIETGDLKL